MLEISNLRVSYGDACAIEDLTLTIGTGELVAVVGSNGAGKTTLVNAIARILPAVSGTITLDGVCMNDASPQDMCNAGVALVPEGRRLFGGMTVEENLIIGAYRTAARTYRQEGLDRVYGMFPILKERRMQVSGTLSGGQQQMVAIGRALMSRPRLLLIDEPSLGLAPLIVEQVFETIHTIQSQGISILLIEQSVLKALKIARRGYVIELGRIVMQGEAAALLRDPHIMEAFLGLSPVH